MVIAIGVTGHRPSRLIVPKRKLATQARKVLSALARGVATVSSAPELDVISPLAEGCDRIVAHEALALKQRLTAVIPFTRKAYEVTFSDVEATAEFRALWKSAHFRMELGGSIARPEAAYVAVGLVTLARADIMLTIWDGKPAAGRGGTPEILQSALDWKIPIIWIHATDDRPPVLLLARNKTGSAPVLAGMARNGLPVTASLLRQLGAELARSALTRQTEVTPRRRARG